MSNPIRDAIHIRRLLQIKQRPNQYPTYDYNIKKGLRKSGSQIIINELSSQIKNNKKNISTVKKSFEKRKPVDYDDEDKYLYDKEVERIQKQMVNTLINNNKKLKNKLKNLKENNYYYQTPNKRMNKSNRSQKLNF